MNNLNGNSITITYLTKVSFASLNGGDKDVDNINPIKKITLSNGQQLPYVSSQAIRRALRDRLQDMGWKLSTISEASQDKGVAKTENNPNDFIDDDLFGFMNAEAGATAKVRTSPIRVESLIALSEYKGDLDYGTNFTGMKVGGNPNIFETEIHSGFYKGTILIELDRIGKNEGFEKELDNKEKSKRVNAFIDAFQNLWSSGRQTRFLADISPKFIAAAYMKVKNPIFMEATNIKGEKIILDSLKSVVNDYADFINEHVFAEQKGVINSDNEVVNLKDGFDKIKSWITKYYEA
jgi:CRISPR-associated protein Cst2